MNRAARGVAMVSASVVMPLVGCSEGGTTGNGLENKSAVEVQAEAVAALRAAESVHVEGATTTNGGAAQIDLRMQNASSSGTITMEGSGTPIEFTTVNGETYVKGDEAALESLGIPAEMRALGADSWLKLSPQEAAGLEEFSLESLARQMERNESSLQTELEQTEINGEQVVVIKRQDGSKLSVANSGPAYPLRVETDVGRLDFGEYDADLEISAPARFAELGELAWLNAIKKLHEKIDEAFAASNVYLTREKMVSFAGALAECSRELARIGSPTERLQPVYALVEEACTVYDEGAKCFDTAIRVSDKSGAVVAGTAEEQTHTRAIECGFAAQGDGSNRLTEAEVEGDRIISSPVAGERPTSATSAQ